MKNNHFFGVWSRLLCCLCTVVLCLGCLSSGSYSWYTETATASGTVQFGQWASAPANLISNGDFSNGLTGWKQGNASNNTIVIENGYLKLARAGNKAPNVSNAVDGTFSAGIYTLSGKVFVSGEENCATAEIEIMFVNAENIVVNQPAKLTFKGNDQPLPMTWTEFSIDVVIPEGEEAIKMGVVLKHTLSAVGYICYDDISVIVAQ